MNVVLQRRLPRRTVLRALGAAIGLPFLDAMRPALAFAAGQASLPHGLRLFPERRPAGTWFPQTEGAIAPLPESSRVCWNR